jgi:membrane protease YdiL (CAAX protease family)
MTLLELFAHSCLLLGIVSVLSYLCYLAAHRQWSGFGEWMGLTWPSRRAVLAAAGAIPVLIGSMWLMARFPAVQEAYHDPSNSFEQASRAGFSTLEGIAAGLIYGFVMTGSSEELFFRGLVARRFYD